MKTALKDLKIVAPKKATLTCEISPGDPPAKAAWFKEGKEIYQSKKYTFMYENSTATLILTDTELNDTGKYHCEAFNKVGRVETEAKIIVQGNGLPQ